MTRLLAWFVTVVLFVGAVPASAVSAQAGSRCFAETGLCISGAFLAYWERNGGLAVFGYPTTEVTPQTIENWTGPVQWFERDRFEDHTAQGQGVLTGRLGADLLEAQGRPWQGFPQVPSAPPDCRYFPETGHGLCSSFLSYWQRNGGLERFGFPITEPQTERIGDWEGQVQYFERRRMELHTELPNQPVLLGLLGNEVRALQGGTAPAQPAQPAAVGNVDGTWRGQVAGNQAVELQIQNGAVSQLTIVVPCSDGRFAPITRRNSAGLASIVDGRFTYTDERRGTVLMVTGTFFSATEMAGTVQYRSDDCMSDRVNWAATKQ